MAGPEMIADGPDNEIIEALVHAGLIDNQVGAKFVRMTGGVSSDIWKVETPHRTFCVKRALAKMKVEADWFAPVERNRFEVAWYERINEIVPGAAPKILAHDERHGLFAMEFLNPARHALWKEELRHGRVRLEDARACGERLSRIHSATAGNEKLAALFPSTEIFHALRLEPYLEATATSHPDLKEVLFGLSKRTANMRLAMIHGDVSPKNILIGPDGPVFLDAECATFGDPAFDLAFCLNHFLLKCLWTPEAHSKFLEAFETMEVAYLQIVDWEAPASLEARAASLLPGLFLARIDGKSPVEYITEEREKEKVRRCARALLQRTPKKLAEISQAWREELDDE
ncbi:MAG: phosphotransferase [Hyphomicrobiales bacterium]